ncbi:hypothetical protein OS189_18165 [Sulfitobacter sp. F26169L]|uniref:hypothetical protein n=1 Tax=Sulfitobacter sp. F26169L TaxID=2996015 RepID=UPI002260D1F4|nr:hypothetical protein [Sulfitobacter sp. F26169L]MCX7568266.1 hypothetical protein [Sulfitobacter sp. F26169L]
MPLILVGTRYQAIMALSIIRVRDIETFHLVIFTSGPLTTLVTDVAFAELMRRAASVKFIDRTIKPLTFQRRLLRLALRQLIRDRTVMTAAISVLQVMMVFRLLPALRCITFDEGGYNVSADSPFRRMKNQSRFKRTTVPARHCGQRASAYRSPLHGVRFGTEHFFRQGTAD